MKTRFSPLVKIKKDMMQKRERELQQIHHALQIARQRLESAYCELDSATAPQSGAISDFLQSRVMITAQRRIVDDCRHAVASEEGRLEAAQAALRDAMVEFEKFEYLEAEQIKNILQERERRQQRELDEIAVQGYMNRQGGE
jgi:flagellar export protein FliJ